MTSERTKQLFSQLWHGADYNYEQWGEVTACDGISVHMRESSATRYVFVMNFTCEDKVIALDTAYTDMLTGKPLQNSLSLPHYGSAILKQPKTSRSS